MTAEELEGADYLRHVHSPDHILKILGRYVDRTVCRVLASGQEYVLWTDALLRWYEPVDLETFL